MSAASDLERRVRPALARPSPYRWQQGVPEGQVDRFDMNTLAEGPAWLLEQWARLAVIPAQDYPDASYPSLRRALGEHVGVRGEQIVLGAGCDEIIGLCAQLALEPGERAVAPRPTYQLYGVVTRNAGAELVAVPPLAGTLAIDWAALVAAAATARLTWLCSPNNPTAEEAPAERVAEVCRASPGIVVLDQAYLELGGLDLAGLLAEHANLIVARTLSKGFGLAAARVGYAAAAPELAAALDALRPPASVSSWSVALAELALANLDEVRTRCAAVVAERERVAAALRSAGIAVDADGGNFVLVRNPVPETPTRLAEQAMVVRTFVGEPLLDGHFRITVGRPEANDRLVAALARLAGHEAPAARAAPAGGRRASRRRATRETSVTIELALDGSGRARIATGLGFLDHMLTALAFWSNLDLELTCRGDLWVDEHHTVEDCAIALGESLDEALGDRAGLRRFGDARAPLDEALAHATVDLSGRGVAGIRLELAGERVGRLPTSLLPHFFDTLARRSRVGLHVEARGDDDHHVAEAAFKATALALRQAIALDPQRSGVASTKGLL